MKRKLIIFIAMMLPLVAMSQGVISRPPRKPTKTHTMPKPPVKTNPAIDGPARNNNSPSRNELQPPKQPSRPTTGTINGHEWVDLGLSVKWATKNVGASSPSDYGDYFAWGETTTKSSYTERDCKTWGKNMSDISGNSQYDAARANWGSSWRLPTMVECIELSKECTWEWTSQGGHNGYRVTSKANGNSIFLPAAGGRDGTSHYRGGELGYYWTSAPNEFKTQGAFFLFFNSSDHYDGWSDRSFGRSVRPVSE